MRSLILLALCVPVWAGQSLNNGTSAALYMPEPNYANGVMRIETFFDTCTVPGGYVLMGQSGGSLVYFSWNNGALQMQSQFQTGGGVIKAYPTDFSKGLLIRYQQNFTSSPIQNGLNLTSAGSSPVRLGIEIDGSNKLTGYIADTRVWNYAATSTQATAINAGGAK
jgi:hypothetical protein